MHSGNNHVLKISEIVAQ